MRYIIRNGDSHLVLSEVTLDHGVPVSGRVENGAWWFEWKNGTGFAKRAPSRHDPDTDVFDDGFVRQAEAVARAKLNEQIVNSWPCLEIAFAQLPDGDHGYNKAITWAEDHPELLTTARYIP